MDSSKERNHHWKGGRTKHSGGYIQVTAPEHPRVKARKSKTNLYIMEHILVMEEKIGRYLEPHENVHHINGQKEDNRPENLELWSRSQPTGQRVRDKIAWAKEILETYGDSWED